MVTKLNMSAKVKRLNQNLYHYHTVITHLQQPNWVAITSDFVTICMLNHSIHSHPL